MRKVKSILLLLVMAISLTPWSLLDICPQHPEGHAGHHGSCHSDMMKAQHALMADDGVHTNLKPLPCAILTASTDDYTGSYQPVIPTASQYAIVIVLFDLLACEQPEQEFFPTPDPQCNSDPPLGSNALRGPPFV